MQPISVDAAPLVRMRARLARLGAPLCLGIDPHPRALPAGLPPNVEGIERFARGIVEAASEHAAAVKINVAFFEAFGSDLTRIPGHSPLACLPTSRASSDSRAASSKQRASMPQR